MTMDQPQPSNPTSNPAPDAPADAGGVAQPRRRSWLRRLTLGLIASAAAFAGVLALVLLMLLSPAGTRLALGLVPGLHVVQPKGSLMSSFTAQKIEFDVPGSASLPKVKVEDFAWLGFRFEHVGEASSGWGVALDTMSARSVAVVLPPSAPSSTPLTLPASLALPLGVRIEDVHVGSLQLSALGDQLITDIHARLSAQRRAGHAVQHRIDKLSLRFRQWSASGALGLAVRQPYALDASLSLQSADALQAGLGAAPGAASESKQASLQDDSVQARLTLAGSLAHIHLQADALAREQRLQAEADIAPFDPWPLLRAKASAQGFNLAVLDARAPQTLLTGQLTLQPPPSAMAAAPQPSAAPSSKPASKPASATDPVLDVQMAWRNDAAGRWSDGRLPVRAVQLSAELSARDGLSGVIRQLGIELGAPGQGGGRVQSTGSWNLRACANPAACAQAGPAWALNAKLDQLRLAALDAAAPALIVSGPIDAHGDAPLSNKLSIVTELTGRVDAKGRERSVVVKLQADAAPDDIQLHMLQAQAGSALLELSGTAQLKNGQWRVQSKGQWSRFDPQLWWPVWFATPDGRAAASSSELNGQLDTDLSWRRAAAASGPKDQIANALYALGGQASIVLDRSRLQGVPVSAHIDLRTQVRSVATTVDASLNLADNHLSLQGSMDYTRPAQDRWNTTIDLNDLQRLAPVARMLGLKQLQGAVDGKAQATGRWPAVSSEASLSVKNLALGWQAQGDLRQIQLNSLVGNWHWGPAWADEHAAIQTQLDLDGLHIGVWQVPRLHASTTGTVRDHHTSLSLDAVLPPGLAAALQPMLLRKNADAPLKVSALLDMQGQTTLDARRGAWAWRGQWQRLLLQPDPASVPGNTLGNEPWLSVAPFETELSQDAQHIEFTATPTRLSLAGAAVALRQLRWSSAAPGEGGPGAVDLEADIEPIRVARVLAAMQPHTGWGGDLLVAGSLRMHRAASAHAPLSLDAEFARQGGDLTLTDAAAEGGAVQSLRLDALRLGLSAHGGVWRFEQTLSGRRLGSITGLQTITTDSAALWPEAHAPLDGKLEFDVANLRLWGIWVPAGWRLAGQLEGRTSFKGTVEQPLLSGYLKGHQLGVRNMLQGVDFNQGELDFEMDSSRAKLNRLTLRAGQGGLTLTGDALLDEKGGANLRLVLDRFAALQRIDRRLVVSGQATLDMLPDSATLRGEFGVDEGLIDISKSGAPTLDDDVRRAGVDDVVADPSDEDPKSRQPVKVSTDVQLDLGSRLRLRGYGLDSRLVGKLKMSSGPPAYKPVVRGTIRTQDGTFAAYGQKLVIDRGAINFNGVIDNPTLDIQATRPQSRMASSASLTATTSDSDVRVGVAITGTAQNPRIRLFSDPEMSETEKLSWLILGHGSSSAGGADLALLQGAASALMGGDSSSMSDGLIQSIGLDEISLRQSDDGTNATVFSVGKQLSKRWYVGYERGLNATEGTWQLIYRLAQRFTLRAQSGLDNSLDFIWVWRWD